MADSTARSRTRARTRTQSQSRPQARRQSSRRSSYVAQPSPLLSWFHSKAIHIHFFCFYLTFSLRQFFQFIVSEYAFMLDVAAMFIFVMAAVASVGYLSYVFLYEYPQFREWMILLNLGSLFALAYVLQWSSACAFLEWHAEQQHLNVEISYMDLLDSRLALLQFGAVFLWYMAYFTPDSGPREEALDRLQATERLIAKVRLYLWILWEITKLILASIPKDREDQADESDRTRRKRRV